MKVRLLKALLNNTDYAISNYDGDIAVGSPLCSDLIRVNKTTLRVKYALDTWNKGREALADRDSAELLFIWDKLHELIASGEIHDIFNGRDVIENPLPVFTVRGGELIERVTDAYGWPNTDDNGVCMYNNTHFPTREQAIAYGIRQAKDWEEMLIERVAEARKTLAEHEASLAKRRAEIVTLKAMLTGKNPVPADAT